MDWGALGKKLGQYGAPLLGAVIPPPAGLAVSAILASKFGGSPDDPDSIARAIDADPQAAVKLKQLELDHDTQLRQIAMQRAVGLAQADAQQVGAVNTTMQAETRSEHWAQWLWRPLNGLLFAPAIIAIYIVLPILGIKAPDVPEIVWVMWGAILGVTAWHRGVKQRLEAGDTSAAAGLAGLVASKLGIGGATVTP